MAAHGPLGDDAPAADDLLVRCQQRIEYQFQDLDLLRAALTHASGADHRLQSNERLEFLGDAILGMVVCEQLFDRYPKQLEGELTKIKSVVVSRLTCAKISRQLDLEEFMILGKGMTTAAEVPPSLLADVFEALVAAIHLDGGFEVSRRFLLRHLEPEIEATVAGRGGDNYKSILQQVAQREFSTTPTYPLLDEKGPDHSKCFQVAAQLAGRRFPPAWGQNKKEAEQRAAENALTELRQPPEAETPVDDQPPADNELEATLASPDELDTLRDEQ